MSSCNLLPVRLPQASGLLSLSHRESDSICRLRFCPSPLRPLSPFPEKNKKSRISLGTKYDSVLPPKFTAFLLPSLTSTCILSFCNGKAPSAANNLCSRPPSATHSPTSDPVHHTIAQSLNIRTSKLLPCLNGLIKFCKDYNSRFFRCQPFSYNKYLYFRRLCVAQKCLIYAQIPCALLYAPACMRHAQGQRPPKCRAHFYAVCTNPQRQIRSGIQAGIQVPGGHCAGRFLRSCTTEIPRDFCRRGLSVCSVSVYGNSLLCRSECVIMGLGSRADKAALYKLLLCL